MEVWKDIKNYEGLYQVSNFGNIKSFHKHNGNEIIVLKQKTDKRGYKRIMLCKNGKPKTITVHRIVLSTFIENKFNYPCINHKDENPGNNNLDNLEWCTQKYNVNYGTGIKRKIEKMDFEIIAKKQSRKVIDVTNNIVYWGMHEAARINNLNFQNIYKCCKGLRNTAGGIVWEVCRCSGNSRIKNLKKS